MNEPAETSQLLARGSVCVVIAASGDPRSLGASRASVQAHTRAENPVYEVPADAAAVNRTLEQLAPADVVVLDGACRVSAGWLERLRDAALSDTNVATVSALADLGTGLALHPAEGSEDAHEDLAVLAETVAEHTLRLRPRLTRAVGPCVYVRREAIELVGPLDEQLDLPTALELDFAQRCLLSGLAHIAADDVVVQVLGPASAASERGQRAREQKDLPARLLERYPYLRDGLALAESDVLTRALAAARGPRGRLWVTIDARALDGAVTGTQVHILELIRALAQTKALRLRLLIWNERIDRETLELLRMLPETEVLAVEDVDAATPKSTVFHRPQQAFSAGDVALAVDLGERVVLSQLDLIAYRNPGYFADESVWEDFRRASRHGLSVADRVVVFSDHTRLELLSDALVTDERIRIVPPGLDHRFAGEASRPEAFGDERGGHLGDGFLLCLGTDFTHKNRVFALRLLRELRECHGWQGSLVLAGTHISDGSSRGLERAFLDVNPPLREAVVELGSVDESEKAWLLAHAGAVVYPSVYEGFGLVPFESALSGVPCVFAPQSSLAEAAPEGTATIVQWDPVQSAEAVFELLNDENARERHVQALATAAGKLTWAAAATSIVETYREAAVAPVREAATLGRDATRRESQLMNAHAEVVQMLIDEREEVRHELEALGPGRGLVGTDGSLPDPVQRALLALSNHPALSRRVYGAVSFAFVLGRTLYRATGLLRGRR